MYFSSILVGLTAIKGVDNNFNYKKLLTEGITQNGSVENTIYNDCYLLPPAHIAKYNAKGISKKIYWHPEKIKPLILKNQREYAEGLYDHFSNAANQLIESGNNWVGTLSAGLDSSATTAMFHDRLAERNENYHVYSFIAPMRDESEKTLEIARDPINSFSKNFHNLSVDFVTGGKGLYDFIVEYIQDFKTPIYTDGWCYVDTLLSKINDSGNQFVIQSQGGNQTISYSGVPSFSSLKQLRNDRSMGLKFDTTSNFINALLIGKKTFAKRNINKLSFKNHLSSTIIFSRDFLKKSETKNSEEKLCQNINNHSPFIKSLMPGLRTRLGMWNMIVARYDIQLQDPTNNIKLIQYCASIPNHFYNNGGVDKSLYKQSFSRLKISGKNYRFAGQPNTLNLESMYRRDMDKIEEKIKNGIGKEVMNMQLFLAFNKMIRWNKGTQLFNYKVIAHLIPAISICCLLDGGWDN